MLSMRHTKKAATAFFFFFMHFAPQINKTIAMLFKKKKNFRFDACGRRTNLIEELLFQIFQLL